MSDDIDRILFPHNARVMLLRSDDALLQLARAQAMDPAVFDARPPFFWSAEISNGNLDSFYTTMGASTVRNYAEDANNGLPFCNSHSERELNFGRSIRGVYQEAQGRALAQFFTVPGLILNGVPTSDLIDGLRSSIVRDVSVGFYLPKDTPEPARYVCSIDGQDMLRSPDCWHIPGLEYEVVDGKGKEARVLCKATIENARAVEVSAAYRGSTPNATTLKAQRAAEAGKLEPSDARLLEDRYRSMNLQLPAARHSYALGNLPKEGETMNELETLQRQVADVRAVLKGAGVPDDKPLDVAVREMADSVIRATEAEPPSLLVEAKAILTRASITTAPANAPDALRLMEAELTRLRPLADDGKRYKADLISAAVTEGVRAFGKEFKEETERAMLEKMDLATIKQITARYAAIAEKELPGGRVTTEGEELPAPLTRTAPVSAFKIS